MLPRSPQEINRQAEENRRQLLAAEATFLYLLLRRRDDAVMVSIARHEAVDLMASRVRDGMRLGLGDGRLSSRVIGAERLRREARSAGIVLPPSAIPKTALRLDAVRAARYSKSFARRWLDAALGVVGQSPWGAATAANKATESRLTMLGATESAHAFNNERREYLIRAAPADMFRQWDAQLDACPTCSAQDGKIVRAHDSFPIGEPGTVHPWCRCGYTLLTAFEAGAYNYKAA